MSKLNLDDISVSLPFSPSLAPIADEIKKYIATIIETEYESYDDFIYMTKNGLMDTLQEDIKILNKALEELQVDGRASQFFRRLLKGSIDSYHNTVRELLSDTSCNELTQEMFEEFCNSIEAVYASYTFDESIGNEDRLTTHEVVKLWIELRKHSINSSYAYIFRELGLLPMVPDSFCRKPQVEQWAKERCYAFDEEQQRSILDYKTEQMRLIVAKVAQLRFMFKEQLDCFAEKETKAKPKPKVVKRRLNFD